MAKLPTDPSDFEVLLGRINQETDQTERKLDILFRSKGNFTAHQASRLLYAFGSSADKLRVMQILDPRLTRMSSNEARDIIGSVFINNDKLRVLQHIKKYLTDCQTPDGMDYILSAFPYEDDKYKALAVLQTVSSDVSGVLAAGGHQGYAALGGLYTQCRPLVPHLYGTIQEQKLESPGHGKIDVPVHARSGTLPSMYTGHPSYAYPPGADYAADRSYPGNKVYSDAQPQSTQAYYPYGAPTLEQMCGAPTPTGFPGLA